MHYVYERSTKDMFDAFTSEREDDQMDDDEYSCKRVRVSAASVCLSESATCTLLVGTLLVVFEKCDGLVRHRFGEVR